MGNQACCDNADDTTRQNGTKIDYTVNKKRKIEKKKTLKVKKSDF